MLFCKRVKNEFTKWSIFEHLTTSLTTSFESQYHISFLYLIYKCGHILLNCNTANFFSFIYRFLKILLVVIFSNYRYAAYRQYIWWVYGRLGRKRRKVIPACVVLAIRKQFPEADGNYTGFKDPSITELDLAFFE